jgi:hypothetical protein
LSISDRVNQVLSSSAVFPGCDSKSTAMPKVLAITGSAMPCTAAAFGDLAGGRKFFLDLTIVGFSDLGFCKVPIGHVGGKFTMDRKLAKPLCEYVPGSAQQSVRCYNWVKAASTFAKGSRIDGNDASIMEGADMSWVLSVGDVLSCKLDPAGAPGGSSFKAGEKSAFTFPACNGAYGGTDIVPAFTLVEVDLDLKSWSRVPAGSTEEMVSSCVRGYALGIRGVRLMHGSVNSHREVITGMSESSEEANDKQRTKSEQNSFVGAVFNSTKGSFCVRSVSSGAHCSFPDEEQEAGDSIELHGWVDGQPKIDLLRTSTYAAMNVSTDVEAAAMVDLCVAAESLSVMCHQNDFRARDGVHSATFGVPLIDVRKLLSGVVLGTPVDYDEHTVQFDAGFSLPFSDDGPKEVVIRISKEPTAGIAGVSPPHSPDMPLVGQGFSLAHGHKIVFAFAGANVIWSGYLSLVKPSMAPNATGANVLSNAVRAGKRTYWGVAALPCMDVNSLNPAKVEEVKGEEEGVVVKKARKGGRE